MDKIDFQPNYLVPLSKLKLSELKNLWKTDKSFRRYVRKFWSASQHAFVTSIMEDLENAGAVIEYDFCGIVSGGEGGGVFFRLEHSWESINGFVEGIQVLQKKYGLFTERMMPHSRLGNEEEDEEDIEKFASLFHFEKPLPVRLFNELKKKWNQCKKTKNPEIEVIVFDEVCEIVDRMEHVMRTFIVTAFDWVVDDVRLVELLEEFAGLFEDSLFYDKMNNRFMEVTDIRKKIL